jgi:hypothetical protein
VVFPTKSGNGVDAFTTYGVKYFTVIEHTRESAAKRSAITQSNSLAIARVSADMNLYVKRLILLALSSIRIDDTDVPTIRVTAKKFSEVFQLSGKSVYAKIQKAAKELMGMVVHVRDPNTRNWEMFHYVDHARYLSGPGPAYVELTVAERLRPYLLELRKEFSQMEAEEVLSLHSVTSMRLFEILFALSYRGKRDRPLEFKIEDLKERLGLKGKYERFKDFKYVLNRAQMEFSKFTSIKFEYEGNKVGRAYATVTFRVTPNASFQPRIRLNGWSPERTAATEDKRSHEEAVSALQALGWVGETDATVRRYGRQRVCDVAEHVATIVRQEGANITNPAGLARSFLEKGVVVPREPEESRPLSPTEIQSVVDAIMGEYQEEQQGVALAVWEGISTSDRELVHARMHSSLNRFVLDRIKAAGWEGPLYEANRLVALRELALLELPEALSDIQSFVVDRGSLDNLEAADSNAVLAQLLLEEIGEQFDVESVR